MNALWAVLVNWNGGETNLRCVRSLLEEGVPAEHIVFVDNASDDGSCERVTAEFPGLVLLRNERNLGYGHGTNRGTRHALEHGAELVLWVNNDLVFAPGTLAALTRELESDSRIGVAGPRVLYDPARETVWAAGGRMTWRQNLTDLIGHKQPDGPTYRENVDVDYVPGCALLVRKQVLDTVGLLEGDYFAYHEDVEFCMKAREAGYRVRMLGEVAAYHAAHSSTGGGYNPRRKYLMGVNTVWFLRRHGTPSRWLGFWIFDVLSLPLVWLYRLPRGEAPAVHAKARGMWDAWRGQMADGGGQGS